jgi:pyrroline-5-carboxylate reductase
MDLKWLAQTGMVVLGCGKMGSAMLAGWLDGGLPAQAITVLEPKPSDWLKSIAGLRLNAELPANPGLVLIAVKPQMMADALPGLSRLGGSSTLFVSVAAGISIGYYESVLGATTPIIRAMPNTPAAVGRGITALVGNSCVTADQMTLSTVLMAAVGDVVMLDSEAQMDAVTGVSGSGPAYVFHLIEALTAAAQAEGLPEHLAQRLAAATVSGAGELARQASETPEQLRINVTSPNGTTAAGLDVLMDSETGLTPLIRRTVAAAANRSRELGA